MVSSASFSFYPLFNCIIGRYDKKTVLNNKIARFTITNTLQSIMSILWFLRIYAI